MIRALRSLLLMALLLAVPAVPARAAEPNLDGTYLSKGLNPDGSEYHGVVRITRKGDSFVVSWMSPYASDQATVLVPTSVGVGVLNGGMLAVSYYSRQTAGVVLYRVEDDGQRLAGSWAVAGDDGAVYAETLTRVPEGDARALPAPSTPPAERQRPRTPARPHLRPGDREI
jgi:hypothetical protein